MALVSLRRLFGIQAVGDLTLNYVQILLYLESHEKGERPSSPEKLAHELGIAELTVGRAYESLLDHQYIAVAAQGTPPSYRYEIRDPNEFVITPLGRKALRPFLGAFGFVEVALVGLLMLGLGVMVGLIYSVYELYRGLNPLCFAVVSMSLMCSFLSFPQNGPSIPIGFS